MQRMNVYLGGINPDPQDLSSSIVNAQETNKKKKEKVSLPERGLQKDKRL